MRRYEGQDLPVGARIAVVSNDAIGNYVVGTPLVQALIAKHTSCAFTYLGGKRTHEFAVADFGEKGTFALHGTEPRFAAKWASQQAPFDLVVNTEWTAMAMSVTAILAGEEGFVCGPSLDSGGRGLLAYPSDDRGDLWRNQEWIAEDLTVRFPFLSSGFIGEIFCRLAYIEGTIPAYKLPTADPSRPIPDVLIAPSASLPEKLWPEAAWREFCSWCLTEGLSVGLLGAAPKVQGAHWKGSDLEQNLVAAGLVQDLRGAFSLPQVHGAIARAKTVMTLDNGILHIAAATSTPVVGLYRYGIHRLWAPPVPNLKVIHPEPEEFVATIPVGEVTAAVKSSL